MRYQLSPSQRRRFEYLLRKTEGCWWWEGPLATTGYGRFCVKRDGKTKNLAAHRVAYCLWVGPIPDGWHVCHRCDQPRCVNPQHLFVGTAADNMADMHQKGRYGHPAARGERAGNAKLTAGQVVAIRERFAAGASYYRLGRDYGVSDAAIEAIVKRVNWRHVP